MDRKTPILRNKFVLVAVVLFNLIWLVLLFLSCQADNNPYPSPTPETGFSDSQNRVVVSESHQNSVYVKDVKVKWPHNQGIKDNQLFLRGSVGQEMAKIMLVGC